MYAKEEGVPVDPSALAGRVRAAVAEVVRKQIDSSIDVVNDGEMSKPSYATYVKDRLEGFGGSGNTFVYQDLEQFPNLAARVFGDPGRSRRKTPACNGPIRVRDADAARTDVENLSAALGPSRPRQAFLTAASPASFPVLRNDHYPSQEAYLLAIADAMREEYQTIAAAGFRAADRLSRSQCADTFNMRA
jgi:5-methyltetrahydropteroyltriglutamate--homocysteine methyltransferase